YREQLEGRSMIVTKTDPLPVECVVRGYLAGSGWKDYRNSGALCGISLPAGLQESERLEPPIFTPSTKAEVGHDENIDFGRLERLLGRERAKQGRDGTLTLYASAPRRCETSPSRSPRARATTPLRVASSSRTRSSSSGCRASACYGSTRRS